VVLSYDPLFDAARAAVDEVLGEGEYARLNQDNLGVPVELRQKLKEQLKRIEDADS
jgi:hypothetical protein